MPVLSEHLQKLEQQLNAVVYEHPQGYDDIAVRNQNKWEKVLVPLLVGKDTAKAITGGNYECSHRCYNEEGDEYYTGYKFVDKARFKLNCLHHSYHIQCILTKLI